MSRTWTQATLWRLYAALIAGLLAGLAAQAQAGGAAAIDGPATAASDASMPAKAASAPNVFEGKVGMVDGANKTGSTLAAMYTIDWSKEWNFGGTPLGENPSSAGARLFNDYGAFAQVKGQGTVTVDKDRNPNKMIDLGVAAGGTLSTFFAYYRLGATAKGEADQGFDQRQFFYGASAQISKSILLFNSGSGTLILNYGRVDPGKDSTRQTLVNSLKPFTRWDAEATYSMRLNNKGESADSDWWLRPRVLALSYRHYQETAAPAAIKAAGKDRNRLGTIRVEFGNVAGQLQGSTGVVPFIQYARGSLPFDKSKDRSVTVGLTFTPASTN